MVVKRYVEEKEALKRFLGMEFIITSNCVEAADPEQPTNGDGEDGIDGTD